MHNKEKVLKIIFENPTKKFHIRELAKLTKLNPNTIINIANKLEKEKIINKNKKQYITEVYANLENIKFVTKKRLFNLSQLYNSGLVDFLKEKYNPKAISIIGSYSKGEDIEKSDIDIVLITNKTKREDISDFEKKLSKKIHLLLANYKDMSKEFYTNLINGVLLHGYIEYETI